VIHEVAAVIRIGSGDDTENIDVVRGRTIAPSGGAIIASAGPSGLRMKPCIIVCILIRARDHSPIIYGTWVSAIVVTRGGIRLVGLVLLGTNPRSFRRSRSWSLSSSFAARSSSCCPARSTTRWAPVRRTRAGARPRRPPRASPLAPRSARAHCNFKTPALLRSAGLSAGWSTRGPTLGNLPPGCRTPCPAIRP
jgi:hypothetical protein